MPATLSRPPRVAHRQELPNLRTLGTDAIMGQRGIPRRDTTFVYFAFLPRRARRRRSV